MKQPIFILNPTIGPLDINDAITSRLDMIRGTIDLLSLSLNDSRGEPSEAIMLNCLTGLQHWVEEVASLLNNRK